MKTIQDTVIKKRLAALLPGVYTNMQLRVLVFDDDWPIRAIRARLKRFEGTPLMRGKHVLHQCRRRDESSFEISEVLPELVLRIEAPVAGGKTLLANKLGALLKAEGHDVQIIEGGEPVINAGIPFRLIGERFREPRRIVIITQTVEGKRHE